tara:strand:- start:122 stop:415 length:294 start_codon:yes stop_codon:yes gene_type:complete
MDLDTTVLNDQALKEMSDQLLEKFKDNEYQHSKIVLENIELRKALLTIYGLTRTLEYISDGIIIDNHVLSLIELCKMMSSQAVHEHFNELCNNNDED